MQQKMSINKVTILLFSLCLSLIFVTSIAVDTIASNQTISDGESIISEGGSFELGFFSPGNSTRRYLGIWYTNISKTKVVWVANRETSLNDKSGVLRLDERGILILYNQRNSVMIWSSNTSGQAQNPVAQLLESGNLVIRNENDHSEENFLWQSFHHPSNTMLPGMKFGHIAPGLDVYISSWKSTDDPSPGVFTFYIDTKGLEMRIDRNSVLSSRSGPWIGDGFSGVPFMKQDPIYSFSFVYNENQAYFTYNLTDISVLTTQFLNENGVMQRFTWIDRINDWNLYSQSPADNCDNYALCGAYGSCTIGNAPICECLNGFVPKNQKDWERADWSSGCVRRKPLDCQAGDGFIKYPNVKLPDTNNSRRNDSMTLKECSTKCLENCSCMGYSNSDVRGNGSGCLLWFGDLIDIKQYLDGAQDLYVRMASSEIVSPTTPVVVRSNSKKKVGIIAGSSSALFFILGLGLILLLCKRKQQNKCFRLGRSRKKENAVEENFSIDEQKEDLELPHFDLSTIANATNNFSSENMLGEGGFGPVYKGKLKDGQEIAVKRLSRDSRQGRDEFMNEVKCIAKLQHRNLVKLLGYCIELEEKILIYEYMPNKSLDLYIFDQTQSMSLDWAQRLHIINGISRGLLYLHQDSRLRIIHRDLKLSNILLDHEMNPKISDFGLARSFGGNETAANTKRVVGTYGYMSPEYAIDGLFSIKSDVFSFGVLVLEIVSGKRNRGFTHPGHQLNLVGHAWQLFIEGRSMELIDTLIVESCNAYEVLRSIHIGLLCVQHCPEDRPSMSAVVVMMSGEGALPQPKKPGFFAERKLTEESSSGSKHKLCSINEVTVTMVDPR